MGYNSSRVDATCHWCHGNLRSNGFSSEIPTPCVALDGGECEVPMVEPVEAQKKRIRFATFATGIVHGLPPDAPMMVLPALALPSRLAGAAFVGMFLVGTVISMGSYTAFLSSCGQALKDRIPRVTEKPTWASHSSQLLLVWPLSSANSSVIACTDR